MKLITYLLFISTLFTNALYAQVNPDPYAYLESIGNEFADISQNTMSYTSAASHGKSARKIEKRRNEVMLSLKQAEANVRKMKPFQGDHAFRDSVVSYLRISRFVLSEDYGKIINLEEVAEQSFDAMEAYLLAKDMANEKLDIAYEKVKEQQNLFATKYNIKLVGGSSKLGKKIETSNKVFAYYNQIYLLFFKSYKNEAYVMEALSRNDINAIEQTKNALLTSAEQDLAKIGPIHAFKGDPSLKVSCQQLLSFYKSEASTKIPELVNFQLKKENFEKMKAAMDAKRPNERTQQDIDNFNKMVKEYNVSINKVNAQQNELDKKRAALLDQWNKASEDFLDRHVPKHNG